MEHGNRKGHGKMVLPRPIRRGPEKVAWGAGGGLGVGWKDRQSEAQGSVLLTTPPTGPFLAHSYCRP